MTTGSVLKVLIYVYDHYMLADPAEVPERHRMLADLQKRGFSVSEVVQAMEWLSALVGEQRATPGSVEPERGRAGLRVFADGELARLSPDSRAFLMLLDR